MNTDVMLSGLTHILPMLIVIVGALVTMLMSVAKSHKDPDAATHELSIQPFVVVSLVTLLAAFGVLWAAEPQTTAVWSGTLSVDRFAMISQALLLAIAGLAVSMGAAAIQQQGIVRGEYFSLTLFSVSGMMLMVSAVELLTFFVGLEIMSLAIYVLVGFRRSDRWSQEAALKYFLSGAFASAFFLFGAALLFGATGTTEYAGIATTMQRVVAGQTPAMATMLLSGATLCVIGFAFKVAAVPFHMWAPDAYQGAPTMVTGFMAVSVKAAAFVSFSRFVLTALGSPSSAWQGLVPVLETLAILTMTIGNLSAVLQRNVKRMLAYSSIAQAGYLLIGIIAAIEGSGAALSAILLYLFIYALGTLGAFGVLIALERRGGRHDENLLNRYAGVAWQHPALGVAFAVCMFALSGIPPTAGFVGKVMLFGPALDAGHVSLVVIAVLNSVVSVYYYLRVVVFMFMKNAPPRQADATPTSPWLHGALAVSVALVLAVGMMPARWIETFSKLL